MEDFRHCQLHNEVQRKLDWIRTGDGESTVISILIQIILQS